MTDCLSATMSLVGSRTQSSRRRTTIASMTRRYWGGRYGPRSRFAISQTLALRFSWALSFRGASASAYLAIGLAASAVGCRAVLSNMPVIPSSRDQGHRLPFLRSPVRSA